MKITRNPIPKGRGDFQRVAPLGVWGEISLKIDGVSVKKSSCLTNAERNLEDFLVFSPQRRLFLDPFPNWREKESARPV